eukprot:6889380-Pyramimonas_sp.AAC.1
MKESGDESIPARAPLSMQGFSTLGRQKLVRLQMASREQPFSSLIRMCLACTANYFCRRSSSIADQPKMRLSSFLIPFFQSSCRNVCFYEAEEVELGILT